MFVCQVNGVTFEDWPCSNFRKFISIQHLGIEQMVSSKFNLYLLSLVIIWIKKIKLDRTKRISLSLKKSNVLESDFITFVISCRNKRKTLPLPWQKTMIQIVISLTCWHWPWKITKRSTTSKSKSCWCKISHWIFYWWFPTGIKYLLSLLKLNKFYKNRPMKEQKRLKMFYV